MTKGMGDEGRPFPMVLLKEFYLFEVKVFGYEY